MLQQSEQANLDYCVANGKTYPRDEWVTIKEYCKRFGIENTETVSNWIKNGIIPQDHTVIIPEYHNIRLVKEVPYHDV